MSKLDTFITLNPSMKFQIKPKPKESEHQSKLREKLALENMIIEIESLKLQASNIK